MYEFRRSRPLIVLLCLALLGTSIPSPVVADEAGQPSDGSTPRREGTERPSPVPALAESLQSAGRENLTAGPSRPDGDPDASLDQARELIKDGDYDHAIEILRAAIERARSRVATLRNAYLLLIKTYVFLGNDFKFKPQGREASNLNYQEAKALIAECLGIRELRHTHPEPASEYPEEMIRFFAEGRSRIFGSFRVAELEPAGAVVLLDADTLRALPGDSLIGDVDLAVGKHLVVVRARGYKDVTEEITISPNSTLERPYHLARRRGAAWYATIGAGAAGVVGGLIALVASGGESSTTPALEPLPPAPPPPSR